MHLCWNRSAVRACYCVYIELDDLIQFMQVFGPTPDNIYMNEDIPPEQIKAGYWVDFEKEREYLAYRDRL